LLERLGHLFLLLRISQPWNLVAKMNNELGETNGN